MWTFHTLQIWYSNCWYSCHELIIDVWFYCCLFQIDFVGLFTYMFPNANVNANTKVIIHEQEYINKTTKFINDLPADNKTRYCTFISFCLVIIFTCLFLSINTAASDAMTSHIRRTKLRRRVERVKIKFNIHIYFLSYIYVAVVKFQLDIEK